jgi:hypothetical protein
MTSNQEQIAQPGGEQEHGIIHKSEERDAGDHEDLEHGDPITRMETATDEIGEHDEEEYHALPR